MCSEKDVHMPAILYRHTNTHTQAQRELVYVHPEGVAGVSGLTFHTPTLVLGSQCGPVQRGTV